MKSCTSLIALNRKGGIRPCKDKIIAASSLSAAPEKPNVVFLLVDDLGWGDFGCYGAEFNETPHIDKLAKDGMLFTNAYAACTVCSPSRAAILSGCYPARLHLTDWIAGHNQPKAKLAIPEWNMKIDLAGLAQRPDQHMDGITIAPLLKDPKGTLPRDTLYWHYPHYHRTKPYGAIRRGDWKLIEFFEEGNVELFDLKSDPKETKGLSKEQPEKAAELLMDLADWRKSVGAQMMTPNPNYDPAAAGKGGKKKPGKK